MKLDVFLINRVQKFSTTMLGSKPKLNNAGLNL